MFKKNWKGRIGFKLLKYAWKKNITPFSIARKFGKLSKSLYKSFVKKRFGRSVENELVIFNIFTIAVGEGMVNFLFILAKYARWQRRERINARFQRRFMGS